MIEARTRYHHGDLHDALVQEGLAMSRSGGTNAIVLREATRRAGVTPRAAYRHFADHDALVRAVARAALAEMAIAIDRRQVGATGGVALLESVGLGYIQFALDESGWFDVAFFAMGGTVSDVATGPEPSDPDGGRSPYRLLEEALASLVEERLLDARRADDAAIMCWAGVHGFATLTSRGPLRELSRAVIDRQADQLVANLVAAVIGTP